MKAYLKSVLLISTISIFLLGCDGDLAGLAIANAGPDQTQVEGTTVTLSGSTNSIIPTIGYRWVEGTTILSTTQTFDKSDFSVGVHNVQLLVILDAGLPEETTLKDTVIISITSNVPYLFSWSDDENGHEPWKVNGRETPEIFKDTIAGTESFYPGGYTHFNGKIFFIKDHHWFNHQSLWSIDADGNNLTDLNSAVMGNLIVAGDYLYYQTNDSQLAVINASNSIQTFSFENIRSLKTITVVDDKVFITVHNTSFEPELYVINRAVSDSPKFLLTPNVNVNDSFGSLTDVNGTLFFNHESNSSHLSSLLKSDGITVETVKAGFQGTFNHRPRNFTAVNDILYFTAYTEEAGVELWRSDGTELGTALVQDIFTGTDNYNYANSSRPKKLVNVNGTLLFVARSAKTVSENLEKSLQAVYTPTPYEINIWKVLTPTGEAFKTGITINRELESVNTLYALGENVFFTASTYDDKNTEDEADDIYFSTLWRASAPFESKTKIQDFPNQDIFINFSVGNSFYFTTEEEIRFGSNRFWLVDDIQPNDQQTLTELLEYTYTEPAI